MASTTAPVVSAKRGRDADDTESKHPSKNIELNASNDEYVKGLETELQELHQFIIKKGFVSEAPLSTRKHLETRPGGVEVMVKEIRKRMFEAAKPIQKDIWDSRHTGVTSDDLRGAMCDFITDIKRHSICYHIFCGMCEETTDAFDSLFAKLNQEMSKQFSEEDRPWFPKEEFDLMIPTIESYRKAGMVYYKKDAGF